MPFSDEAKSMIAAALSPFAGPWLALKYDREQDEIRARSIEAWHWERIARGPLDTRKMTMAMQKLNRVARPHRYTMHLKIRKAYAL